MNDGLLFLLALEAPHLPFLREQLLVLAYWTGLLAYRGVVAYA